ncbi:MAG: hypothetical protein F082_396 [bacterium F082]|nr:MAG: hypothetical protein F082_396 [bacterium F082]KWW30095.1 MAG: hypothetical protein AUK64_884 [bacterium P201]
MCKSKIPEPKVPEPVEGVEGPVYKNKKTK